MHINAIIADVDGTLITYHGTYDKRLPSLIKQVQAMGIQFSVATGKAYFGEIARIIKELDLSALNITFGGGAIIDWHTGATPWLQPISTDSAQRIIDYMEKHAYVYSIETLDHAYMSQITETRNYTKDIQVLTFSPHNPPQGILKILFNRFANKMDADHITKPLNDLSRIATDIEVVKFGHDSYYGIDITAENSTKHTAVLEYAKLLKIEPSTIVAIGDGYNDYPLFTACGHSIAMGDAPQELKDIADKVVLPTAEGGMVEALRYILTL